MKPVYSEKKYIQGLRFIFLIILFLSVGLWLSAITAVSVMFLAKGIGGSMSVWLAEQGWDRVMRRCIVGWGVIFLAFFLKRVGWKGWKDCGFVTDDPEWSLCSYRLLAIKGVFLGLITLGGATVLNMLLEVRCISPVGGGISLVYRVLKYIVSGVIVALLEETICRGILFRLLARLWSAWPAAIVISLFFSLSHFVSPAPEAFNGDSFISISTRVFISTFAMIPKEQGFFIRFVNLSLLGIVLCAFVIRTKTIWFGIGAHAAWVWVIKINTYFTDPVWSSRLIHLLGRRGDLMDSFLATAIMALLACWSICRSAHADVVVWRNRLRWHVAPNFRKSLKSWVDNYFENESKDSKKLLKEYKGCRVTAHKGLVLKEYWPRHGWKGIRFAIMPPRCRRTFLLAHQLIDVGIAAPEPLAWAVKRRFCFIRTAYAVTREIEGSEQLTDWLNRNFHNQEAGIQVMKAYGILTAMFHRNGYYNRDLKHENVLCSANGPTKLWVVDLDGVGRRCWITRRRAKRDLMRIGLSLADLGWSRQQDINAFFSAYNSHVPPRLQINSFPA